MEKDKNKIMDDFQVALQVNRYELLLDKAQRGD